MKKNDAFQRIKRFYKAAASGPDADGFAVLLDGRKAKTPSARPLRLPTQAAADLVASEWAAQVEWIVFSDMPASRHAFTAIDRVVEARAETAAELGRFAASDLLCYFAEEPKALVARQREKWTPLLDWAEDELGLMFVRTTGILYQAQPPETLHRAEELAGELNDFALAGLAWASALFGSAILAFALQRGRIGGYEAFELSRLDEDFQVEQWGVDDEDAERTAKMREEADLLERWFAALR